MSTATPAVFYLVGSRPSGILSFCRTLNRTAVFRSGDGGATWTLADQDLPGESLVTVAVDPADSRVLYVGTGFGRYGQPFGVWKSADAGASWQRSGLQDRVVTEIAASPRGDLWASAQGGQVFRSRDAGTTWQDRSGGTLLDAHEFAFDPPGRVYAAGFGGVRVLDEGD